MTDATPRPLLQLARLFADSLQGDADVDVARFARAFRALVRLVEGLGPFAALSVIEAGKNLEKIEAGAAGGSLDALLRAEAARAIHGAGGVLHDPSAAMGVLWLGRLLHFWEEVCGLLAQPAAADGEAPALKRSIDVAYERTLLSHHGWVTEGAFRLAVQVAPQWEDVRHHFAPDDECFRSDVREWMGASQPLLTRITRVMTELDLVDARKTP
jgi:hypothetical protein